MLKLFSVRFYIPKVFFLCFMIFLVLQSFTYAVPIFALSPEVFDDGLVIERVVGGLKFPTTIEFLGEDDFIVGERGTGKVFRVVNETVWPVPILDANVSNSNNPASGLFGLEAIKLENETVYVYVSMLETGVPGTDHDDFYKFPNEVKPRGNMLYRYELEDNRLVKPKLLSHHQTQGRDHFGGALRIGPDDKLYYIIGDNVVSTTQAVNLKTAPPPDGQSGILRMNLDGSPVAPGILGGTFPTNLYYAYGIRNGFGIDFDPLTGNLWDTENGPTYGDEINLVLPGFNSGWRVIQGAPLYFDKNYTGYNAQLKEEFVKFGTDVVNRTFDPVNGVYSFDGKGQYRDPELSWNLPVAPTAIKFLKSDNLGGGYQNDIFVGDFNHGNVYHFDLNKNRTSLLLNGSLTDKVAENINGTDYRRHIFANGFDRITDIEEGMDGYLYIVSYMNGTVYRIVPKQ